MDKFKAPWWLCHRHLQTIFSTLIQNTDRLNLIFEDFQLSDSDKIELHWTENKEEDKPLLILMPGITGNSHSPYIKRMMLESIGNNYKSVCFHLRGLSERLQTAKIYHAGFTNDLDEFLYSYLEKNPKNKIYIIGYSIGSNILLKWLSQSKLANEVTACVCVSVPFNLLNTVQNIDIGFSKIYQKIIMKDINRVMSINFKRKFKYKKIYDFDDKVTSKMHGYNNAIDYYTKNSSKAFLKNIQTPTLIIQAKDDPFLSKSELPEKNQLSEFIQLELSEHGGHIGFIEGNRFFKPNYWLEKRIWKFIKSYEK